MFHSFEDLEVWKRACCVAVRVYELLLESRDFGLRDQMQRAAVSVASNIAEGSEYGRREFVRYLRIARGSAAELRTQVYIAAKVGAIDRTTMGDLAAELSEISKMLRGLSASIEIGRRRAGRHNTPV